MDSRFQVLDSGFLVSELGKRIPILSEIQDSFSCITYSKAPDFAFQAKIPDSGIRIPLRGAKTIPRRYSSLMVYGQVARNQSQLTRNAELISSKLCHASIIS